MKLAKYICMAILIIIVFVLGQVILLPVTITIIEKNILDINLCFSFLGNILGGLIGAGATIITLIFTIRFYEKQYYENAIRLTKMPIIDKINQILDQIAERNTISSSLYFYINELNNIRDKIDRYNELQGYLLAFFTNQGIEVMEGLYGIDDSDDETSKYGKYYKLPDHIIEKGKRIGKKSLYENCYEMFRGDEELGRFIDFEAGGSYGLWAANWCVRQLCSEPEFIDMRDEFLLLIPDMANQLEAIKIKLMK